MSLFHDLHTNSSCKCLFQWPRTLSTKSVSFQLNAHGTGSSQVLPPKLSLLLPHFIVFPSFSVSLLCSVLFYSPSPSSIPLPRHNFIITLPYGHTQSKNNNGGGELSWVECKRWKRYLEREKLSGTSLNHPYSYMGAIFLLRAYQWETDCCPSWTSFAWKSASRAFSSALCTRIHTVSHSVSVAFNCFPSVSYNQHLRPLFYFNIFFFVGLSRSCVCCEIIPTVFCLFVPTHREPSRWQQRKRVGPACR